MVFAGALLEIHSIPPRKNGTVSIISNYSLIRDSAQVTMLYKVDGRGVISVNYTLDAASQLPNIPRVGMQMGIHQKNDQIKWYGLGPLENYVDRRYGFDAAVYQQPIASFMEPYVVPQENANRTDVRWMYLSDAKTKMDYWW